jgi:hypothetical protein
MLPRALASFFLALALAMVTSRGAAWANAVGGEQIWLVASDIHLNPFARKPNPSLVGSDTNAALFVAALVRMRRAVPNPAVVLIPGDFLTHDFERRSRNHARNASPSDDAIRTMQTIATGFGRAFPYARFAIAVGNNDAPCGDYRSALGTPYLAAVARTWAPLVNRGGAAPDFAQSFAAGGHYTATLPIGGLRLVAIDSVPLSVQYAGDCAVLAGYPPARELTWLAQTLAATPPGMRNVVMMHVPPGYDAFSMQASRGLLIWPFLYPDANATLLATMSAPENRVAYAIAGHSHRFDFRLDGNVPVLVFGSISPVYRNNPAFFALHVGPDGSIRDIDIYAFDEWSQEWQPPRSFDALWHVTAVDASTLAVLHARRIWDSASSGFPSNWHVAWSLWGSSWRVPWCAQTYLSGGFAQCAGLVRRTLLPRLIAILVVLLAVGVVVLRAKRPSTAALRASAQDDTT